MVTKGVVLGHKISKKGIKVDRAKVEVIEKLPPPCNVKGIRSLLGHAGFYRRFIRDFSKVAKPLSNLLVSNVPFVFDNKCMLAFEQLKNKLSSAPIIAPPCWDLPFELMCDALDFVVGAVLRQRKDKWDRSGAENKVADHLSRILQEEEGAHHLAVNESFPDEQLMMIQETPWFADIANFKAIGELPTNINKHMRRKLIKDAKYYIWDEPYLFKKCADRILRRCISHGEGQEVLWQCHGSAIEATLVEKEQQPRCSNVDSTGQAFSMMQRTWCQGVINAKGLAIYPGIMRCHRDL
ncbi:uncharacterized protein LOC130980834 [Arachis stenosperma]|uniref:uncharacterized protein LOC130980834 n=1 Tax=Arachis stenosperma TaxID=217475 RepID=UPI0025AC319F|nr:uncharacterized protein LOC130980834 [Arachis stenosperma]